MEERNYEAEQIGKKLVGFTITEAVSSDEGAFGFIAKKGKKSLLVWVDQDPEGNGPGHLEIEEK